MCGIAGILDLQLNPVAKMDKKLSVMGELLSHRGPDGKGQWHNVNQSAGFSHRRLSIVDLTDSAAQPMLGSDGNVVTFNGEIYNYKELQQDLSDDWSFKSSSDTECILATYYKYGQHCLEQFRGMFSFALWDERNKSLFCARDRFGIKPFYYCIVDGVFHFASEAKALLPFLDSVKTNSNALAEYLTFQYTIGEKTLFDGIFQLLPGHALEVRGGKLKVWRYWDVKFQVDYDHSNAYFKRKLRQCLEESVDLHLRGDVAVGSYVSGGIDSSLIHTLANKGGAHPLAFNGRFNEFPGYDESHFAKLVTDNSKGELQMIDIVAADFQQHIQDVIYHLDFPVAGPGAFAQYMVSKLASEHVKVVLGGQGGDEIFGGYARYMIAYLEQCLNAAIEGTYKNGNYVVTIESIIPNMGLLREYKPLMKEFWRDGLFEPMDKRYFRLVDRSSDMGNEVDWSRLDRTQVFNDFCAIFNNADNVRKEAYFDKMTHFDFKCLLPALLQVEDRMSMAHGLESRVPLLDHPLIELSATVPADVKFKNGEMKRMLKREFNNELPKEVMYRRDKMGFPVPLKEWFSGELNTFVRNVFQNMADKEREYFNAEAILQSFGQESRFSRKTWGLLSLELWHQRFHDRAAEFRNMII